MYSTKILFAFALLTGTTLSQKSDSEYCSAFFTSFLSVILNSDAQTPTGIASWVAQRTPTTTAAPLTVLDFASHAQELCTLATELPSSLLPEFRTYAADLLEWGKLYSSEHIAYVTDCAPESEVASRSSYLEYVFTATDNFCTETPAPGARPAAITQLLPPRLRAITPALIVLLHWFPQPLLLGLLALVWVRLPWVASSVLRPYFEQFRPTWLFLFGNPIS
ncbi:hypothetical protein NUW58_g2709 [Xylaria curta]|uniref:Uncharacterized protein n=1 Tax=Xylaria curta TaxID=42375 RepID=A0ACC1PE83_9PEZI|nr:hypothetical protein NUW58_g2709 [Xylaria curta]